MNYNNFNSNQNRAYSNCPPRQNYGYQGQAALPQSSMSISVAGGCPKTTGGGPCGYSGMQYGYQPQRPTRMGSQQVGRRSCRPRTSMSSMPTSQNVNMPTVGSMQQQAGYATPNPYAPQGTGPSPINVNISAAMLASANNTPAYTDRGEASVDGNSNVKYIPLSWDAILGKTGMNGMQVSMIPPSGGDSSNQNRQLKVSFGGQGGAVQQGGETPLRVVSFQPVSTGRMDAAGQGGSSPMNLAVGAQSGGPTSYMGQTSQAGRVCNCPNCRR